MSASRPRAGARIPERGSRAGVPNAPAATTTTAAPMRSPPDSSTADARGPEDYKRHLVGELTRRALRRAPARALHQEA